MECDDENHDGDDNKIVKKRTKNSEFNKMH